MKVEDLMTTEVGTCRPYDGVDRSAQVMWEQDCGAVPVVDQDRRVVAMLTDRDICMAAFTQGRALSEIRVSTAMSRSLWSCHPGDDVANAEALMRSQKVRRLPVVDMEGKLVGILSLSDIARAAVKPKRGKTRRKGLEPSDVGHTLGAISAAGGVS